jgi:uncharacterized protein YcaQ
LYIPEQSIIAEIAWEARKLKIISNRNIVRRRYTVTEKFMPKIE